MLTHIMQSFRNIFSEYPLWTLVAILLVVLYISKWVQNKLKRYPPGPTGLPILGYLPYLGGNVHLDLDKLRKKYGDIFSMKWGIRDVVVLSDFKLIKEAFNKDEISDRPPGILNFTEKEGMEHIGTMNLKDWKESRRFTLSTLRTLGMGKNKVEEAIMEEIQSLVERLSQSVGKREVHVGNYVYPTVNRVIISMICGSSLSENPKFCEIVDRYSRDVLEYLNITAQGFYLPLIKPLLPIFKPKLRKLKRSIDDMEKLMWNEISKHKEDDAKYSKDDYMDYFIGEMKKITSGSGTFTDGVLNSNSQVLLIAGSDTTLTTIEWLVLLLAQHPKVQERAYQEIVQVAGKERPPSWSDKDDLPYFDAVIAEASRLKTIAPLNVAHWVGQDTTIGQYKIPRGTMIVANLHSVHMNPDLWNKPESFNPDRFMTHDGKRAKDPEYLIPFSIGKRFCAGEKLARMEVFLFLGAILQRFKIIPPPGGINMNSKLDIVLHATNPVVRFETRQ